MYSPDHHSQPPDEEHLSVYRKELKAVEKRIEDAKMAMSQSMLDATTAAEAIAKAVEIAKNTHRRPLPTKGSPVMGVRRGLKRPLPFEATNAAFDATAARKRAKANELATLEAERRAREAAELKALRLEAMLKARDALKDGEGEEEGEGGEEGDVKIKEATDEELQQELRRRWQDDAAERSRARRVNVECPGCGEHVQLMNLAKHQQYFCANRKVSGGEYTARLPSPSYYFMLLLMSPTRVRVLYAHVAVNSHCLPLSPAVPKCLQPV